MLPVRHHQPLQATATIISSRSRIPGPTPSPLALQSVSTRHPIAEQWADITDCCRSSSASWSGPDAHAQQTVTKSSATNSGAITRSDASTFTLDLSALQPDVGPGQAAVDARAAAGVADWAQADNNDAIDDAKLANAPYNSVTSETLSGTTATFTKAEASDVHLDLSGLRNPHAFGGIAYDQSENTLTLTTADDRTIDVDLDTDYPPPTPGDTPTPSTDASLASLTLGGVADNSWQPRFASDTYSYNVRVEHAIFRTFVEPHTNHAAAIFAVSDNRAGQTVVTIRVAAENGTTHQAYTATVHRASSQEHR